MANPAKFFATILAFTACDPASTTDETPDRMMESSQTSALGDLCHKNAYQPAGCAYGSYCQSTSGRCSEVPIPTCTNFTTHGTSWNASTSTGPVIYDTSVIRFTLDPNFCGSLATKRVTFRLKAYAPTADLPTSLDEFSDRLRFVTSAGNEFKASAIQNITTTDDRKNVTFDVNLCAPSETTSYTAGFFFVGGSEICVTAS